MDTGPEAIRDPAELARVRRQARAVHVKSVVSAVLLTVLALVV
jgi:hypothetical protein